MRKVTSNIRMAIRDAFKSGMGDVYNNDIDGRCECVNDISIRFDVSYPTVEQIVGV